MFEAKARAAGLANFQIVESAGSHPRAADRDEYFPVLNHVAFGGQPSISGIDMASDPIRLKAILRARDTGSPASTAQIRNLALPAGEAVYLVVFPVYASERAPSTLEERRRQFRGVVFGAFSAREVLAAAIAQLPYIEETIAFTFAPEGDEASSAPATLFAVGKRGVEVLQPGIDPTVRSAYRATRSFVAMGQRWYLTFDFPVELVDAERSIAPMSVLLAGLLMTAALGFYLIREGKQLDRTRAVVAAQTADLRDSNVALSAAQKRMADWTEVASDWFWEADVD